MGLSTPLLLGVLLFVWTVWAVLFWGSIALIERHNPYNKFKWALLWSAAEIGVSIAIGNLGFGGLGLLLAWLGFLIRLLLNSYELGLLHAIGVVIVTVVGPYFVFDAFDAILAYAGSSETMLLVLLYGAPAVVFAIWLWPRPATAQPTNLPAARIEKLGRKRPATAPAFTTAPAPLRAVPISGSPTATTAPAPAPAARVLSPFAAPSPLAAPSSSPLAASSPSPLALPVLSPLPAPAVAPATPVLAAPAASALPAPAFPAPVVAPATSALPAIASAPPASDPPRDVGEPSFLR